MTCFWDGLMNGLKQEDFNNLNEKKTNNINFIKMLQKKNKITKDVLWNGKLVNNQKELEENYIAVRDYDINKINNGHLCSTGDYMLMLICDLFNINIYHKYLNKTMKYEKNNNNKSLYFQSNKGHFWFVK